MANKQQFASYEDKRTRIPVHGNTIRFGVISDTHIGSKYCQMSFLKWYYTYLKKIGAQFVLHAGDIVDGEKRYRGHDYEVFLHGFDEQLDYTVKNYPRSIPTYFITGNHCLTWFERGGADIGTCLAKQREDLHYLGQMGAYVYFGHLKAYIVHGLGSPAYALSYRAQKMVEAFSSENKPNLLCIGHFHSAFQSFIRNVYAMCCGGFQGQTPFLRRMAQFPVIGGYIIEIEPDKRGIFRFKYEFLPCYRPKAHDYP